jgi:hypothetical protein
MDIIALKSATIHRAAAPISRRQTAKARRHCPDESALGNYAEWALRWIGNALPMSNPAGRYALRR